MNKKFLEIEAMFVVAMFLLSMFAIFPAYTQANQVYLVPASLDLTGKYLGYKFYVIVWADVTDPPGLFVWQLKLTFPSWLNCTGAGYSCPLDNPMYPHDASHSEMFHGLPTVPIVPIINNVEKYVMHAEALIIFKASGNKRLMWAEFEIVAVPPEQGSLTGAINSDNMDTFLLDPELNSFPITKDKCDLVFNWVPKFEKFGPRADKLLIQLYSSAESEWEALARGEIDMTDWPLTEPYYDLFTSPPLNETIKVIQYGPGLFKAMSRRYVGATPGEANYTGSPWLGVVNMDGVGIDNFWSFLNMHPEGYECGDGENMTIRLGSIGVVTSLNPIYATDAGTGIDRALGSQWPRLCEPNPNTLEDIPWLVENFTVGTYVHPVYGTCTKIKLTLRTDATWTDGIPITIADVYFTFVELRKLLSARGLPPPSWYNNIKNILDFRITDPYNFEILLNALDPAAVPPILENIILPKHIWKPIVQTGDPTTFAPDPNMISSGPYRMQELGGGGAGGGYVVLVANAPGSTVTTNIPGSKPVTSPRGYWRFSPWFERLSVRDPPEFASMHKMPPGTNATLHWNFDNLYATQEMEVLVGANITIDGNKIPFIVNETMTLPPSPEKDQFLSVNIRWGAVAGFGWDSGVHRRNIRWTPFAWYDVDVHIWFTVTVAARVVIDVAGIDVWGQNFAVGAIVNLNLWFTVGPLLRWPWYPNCVRVVIDPSLLWFTIKEDITGRTLYDDIGVPGYPYKSELPSPDFKVDMKDIATAAKAFGSYPGHSKWNTVADITGDYKIDIKDIAGIAKKFGWVG